MPNFTRMAPRSASTLLVLISVCTREEAVQQLAAAYRAVLAEFATSGLDVLRLLPISGGVFARGHAPNLPFMTAEALLAGFHLLDIEAQTALRAQTIDMCIFMERDLSAFDGAFGAYDSIAPASSYGVVPPLPQYLPVQPAGTSPGLPHHPAPPALADADFGGSDGCAPALGWSGSPAPGSPDDVDGNCGVADALAARPRQAGALAP